ncbi:MAG: tetraacyldisaccharide 4'-kinase, partial [Flavobacteriaceae bacterium]|nr:tetraacyldisaccharide 4'-kinase [Flavobacteriaceae bacterium]
MKWIRTILFFFFPIKKLVTSLRNWLYDKGIKATKTYDIPVLCVGNLSVG